MWSVARNRASGICLEKKREGGVGNQSVGGLSPAPGAAPEGGRHQHHPRPPGT
jgi:hypothetical protein